MLCVGDRGGGGGGECFLGTCAHPVDQSSNSFTHSFRAPVGYVITSSAGPPVIHMHHAPGHAFCCMMSNMPVCAGGKKAALAP